MICASVCLLFDIYRFPFLSLKSYSALFGKRGAGHTVLQADCPDTAIEVATRHTGVIPLIVSDVVLPEMSGPSVVGKLQRLHPEMRALYVSGYAEVPVAQQLIAAGAILLQKPVSRKDLLAKVDDILHPRTSDN